MGTGGHKRKVGPERPWTRGARHATHITGANTSRPHLIELVAWCSTQWVSDWANEL